MLSHGDEGFGGGRAGDGGGGGEKGAAKGRRTHDGMPGQVDYEEFRDGVVTLARKDLAPMNSYWSKCYVAGAYGDSSLDCGAQVTSNAQGHLLAGFIAGVTAKTLTGPLEVHAQPALSRRCWCA